MDYTGFWLLNAAVDAPVSMQVFALPGADVVCDGPLRDMEPDSIAARIEMLCVRGHLIGMRSRKREKFIPTRDQLLRGIDADEDVTYGLTPKGGGAWEALAKPNWAAYVSWRTAYDRNGIVGESEIEASSETRLTEHLAALEQAGYEVIPGTEKRANLKPWPVFYWKTLSEGLRLTIAHHMPVEEGAEVDMAGWFQLPAPASFERPDT